MKAHWDVLAAADFFSVEVWTATGLTRCLVLFVIELATRRVHIAGISAEPDSAWVTQCRRQLTDAVDGFLLGKRFLLHDRDPLFSEAFRETLAATGVEAAWAGQRSCVLTSNLSSAAPPRKEMAVFRLLRRNRLLHNLE